MQAKLKTYILSIVIALAVGGFSAFLTRTGMNIYDYINKPALSPPAILFPIVRTALYILMGVSSARIGLLKSSYPYEATDSLVTYAIQLILNFFWSIIFFNMRTFLFSLIWLIVLWSCILKMIFKFSVLDRTAACLNIPYFLWVTFAGYLNFMIYILN